MYHLVIEGDSIDVLGSCSIHEIGELGRQIQYAIQS